MNKHLAIPDFLLDMSRSLNSQNNRSTADPIFQVKQPQYFVTEEGYSEHHYEIFDEEGSVFSSESSSDEVGKRYLLDKYRPACESWLRSEYEESEIEGRGFDELFQDKFNLKRDVEDFHDALRRICMQEVGVVLHTCFTEKEALAIKELYHPKLKVYVYAVSLNRAPETKKLRNWIKSLTESDTE